MWDTCFASYFFLSLKKKKKKAPTKCYEMRFKNPSYLIKLILQEEVPNLLDKCVLIAVVSDLLLDVAEIKCCKDS